MHIAFEALLLFPPVVPVSLPLSFFISPRSDVSFAVSPSILLFLPARTLNEIQLTFSRSADLTTVSACIRAIKWQVVRSSTMASIALFRSPVYAPLPILQASKISAL
ncbi:hypothetical protein ARMGADRAFT_676295 [Armillaria gallica]|uniref:Uncharacterized protein n=1 Tax=Armillaria gallica TaxID=47427 RepID=A0A2H3CJY8_ARMGA|nr:hypothetical protein ARMGADRAFT_676295 [Armillaria gallica]